ncbi:Heterotrimeric G-protein alpha subunit, GPA3-like protein [Mycena venus]|uniref:Heterotrimeric G-protein alpha subunit, GPA3-like protein n=1 Tax=Mycena venus TaxID=2733690 RepID=A0A8H6XR91_9AGAR|nr:Heterotrimeric G-protein alpha subunit, GPA3-like protein [Mycena venus]
MPPPPSVRSLHSWWSDSNSIGATFDLHAVAKPLIRLLYHRQARNFIKENAAIPLSDANADIFLSYLAFKYTSSRTKSMVLRHLSERVASEKDAQMLKSNIVQSNLLVELLNSPDEETRYGACLIIDQLALHNLPALEIQGINPRQRSLKERLALKKQPAWKKTRAEKTRSDAIHRAILEDSKRYRKEAKVLVLGLSESGKSTIVRQMKIVHDGGCDERERAEYRTTIYKNVLDSVGTLARIVRKVGIRSLPENVWEHTAVLLAAFPASDGDDAESNAETEMESVESGSWITAMDSVVVDVDPVLWITAIDSVDVGIDPTPFTDADRKAETEAKSVESDGWITAFDSVDEGVNPVPLPQTHSVLTPALVDAVWHIWRSLAVERVADEHLTEFYLMEYFFSSIYRIAEPNYIPNEKDILHARTETNAIRQTRFVMPSLSIHLFDVTGQRFERKKWIQCFQSATSIIFCAALSDYDQVLKEDRRLNRMRESLILFESVINSRWFLRTSVILFLTKIDLFKKKLPRIPLKRYFPEYTGGSDLNKAAKYILWEFMQKNRARLSVYSFLAQEKDMKTVRLIFGAVKDTINRNALKDSGIL